jgi:hypothetical protein
MTMRQSRTRFFGWRVKSLLVIVAVCALATVLPHPWGGYLLGALLAGLLVVLVLQLGLQLSGVDADVPDIARRLSADPEQQRLLTRWLSRARWARFVGGFAGVLAGLLGARGPQGLSILDLLLFGTGGIAIGAMVAELHHVTRRHGPRSARLEVRTIGDYIMRQDQRRMVGVATAATAVAIAGLSWHDARAALWWGLAALVMLAVTATVQWRVATRPRPALTAALTRADDLARELAIGRGLARPATIFGLTLVARGAHALIPAIGRSSDLLSTAAWLFALYLWWHNRRLGLDFLMSQPGDPVLS